MIRLFILLLFSFNVSSLFSQDLNKNIFSQQEIIKLSEYGKELERAILDRNASDTLLIAKIAKLKGDYSTDLYGYTDEAVIKISNYFKELSSYLSSLERQDSIELVRQDSIELARKDSINNAIRLINQEGGDFEVASVEKNNVITKNAEDFTYLVLFDINSYTIKDINLFSLVYDLQLNKELIVSLVGHTDASGSDNFNLNLSVQRAAAVKRYLIKKGIAAERIAIKGEGEWQPVADNGTEEGRAKNRRVEISVK